MIRERISDRVGDKIAQTVRILYSGEICHGSAPMFLTQEDIDGAVFCPKHDSECFINIVNSGMLVDRREEELKERERLKLEEKKRAIECTIKCAEQAEAVQSANKLKEKTKGKDDKGKGKEKTKAKEDKDKEKAKAKAAAK